MLRLEEFYSYTEKNQQKKQGKQNKLKENYVQYRSASLSINPASRAGACTDCGYIECTIAMIIIVILVQHYF